MPKARTTCTRCSRRHQSCDRNVPCLRCVKANEAESCRTEWEGGYDAKVCRTYLPTRRPNHASGSQNDGDADLSLNEDGAPISPESESSSVPDANRGIQDISAGIEDVKLRDTVETHLDARYTNMGPSQPLVIDCDSVELNAVLTLSEMQELIPPTNIMKQLVSYHEHYLAWYHGTICVQVFNEELAKALGPSGEIFLHSQDLRWCAMLFSIMAQSITCGSEGAMALWGYDRRQKVELGRRWFECTVSCLNRGKYTSRPSIHSVHAIESLAMSAHPLGFSNDQFVLYGNAVRIAQALGLQHNAHNPEKDDIDEQLEPINSAKRRLARQREIERRVWTLLCTQDWFGSAYTGMYWLHRDQFSTALPRHYDDETMAMAPEHIPMKSDLNKHILSMSWHSARYADATRGLADNDRRYEQIQIFDAELRMMGPDSLPPCFAKYRDVPWIRWGCNIITILQANRLLLMHRPFLNKSFTDSRYAFTRWASVDASKTIMFHYEITLTDSDRPAFWNDLSHLVTATITLSIDVLHRSPHEPEFNEHRKLVEVALACLRSWADRSVIASRGSRVISSLWKEVSKYHRSKTLPAKAPKPAALPAQMPAPVTVNWRPSYNQEFIPRPWTPPTYQPSQHPSMGLLLQQPVPSQVTQLQSPSASIPDAHITSNYYAEISNMQPIPLDPSAMPNYGHDMMMADEWSVPDMDPLIDLSWINSFPNSFPMTDVEGESFVNEIFRSAQPR